MYNRDEKSHTALYKKNVVDLVSVNHVLIITVYITVARSILMFTFLYYYHTVDFR